MMRNCIIIVGLSKWKCNHANPKSRVVFFCVARSNITIHSMINVMQPMHLKQKPILMQLTITPIFWLPHLVQF
jgi:hypothetical protein